jgi:hypothetical protein
VVVHLEELATAAGLSARQFGRAALRRLTPSRVSRRAGAAWGRVDACGVEDLPGRAEWRSVFG